MKANDKPTPFLNVQVTAIPEKTQAGEKRRYKTTFHPEKLVVTEPDTVINYQLVEPTPPDVQFRKVVIKPGREDQLSEPTISESGKLVTFSNANTRKVTFNLTLHFKDESETEFAVDPEMENQPEPTFMLSATLVPEMPNQPEPT